MAEIFLQKDIISLLDNKFIVIIGDSIQRGVYKDLVLLLQQNKYLTEGQLRAKGEYVFSGDQLIEGGQYGEMTNGTGYREVRQYQTDFHLVRFYFVTRCYNTYMESILTDLAKDPTPDVLLMNSCLWDISRYGVRSVDDYKVNMRILFRRLSEMLPESCLTIWNTTLPISKKARGGVLIPAIEFMNSSLRLDILEANFFIHKLAVDSGVNVLDLHYFLRHQLQRRANDGVHWDMTAHRRITNLILTHIAEAWSVKPPDNARRVVLKQPPQPPIERNPSPLMNIPRMPLASNKSPIFNQGQFALVPLQRALLIRAQSAPQWGFTPVNMMPNPRSPLVTGPAGVREVNSGRTFRNNTFQANGFDDGSRNCNGNDPHINLPSGPPSCGGNSAGPIFGEDFKVSFRNQQCSSQALSWEPYPNLAFDPTQNGQGSGRSRRKRKNNPYGWY